MKQKVVVGILAHVDAGKTTLSESLLFETGTIRKLGRVDTQDAFLDTDFVERRRGITIYTKNARIPLANGEMILIDTPGHVDFSAETERALSVLDAAILLISASAGIQSHTKTLWKLLQSHGIPVFLFINKMDMPGIDQKQLLAHMQSLFSEKCISFQESSSNIRDENIATCEESLMEEYLFSGSISTGSIHNAIFGRQIYPVFFGSALKMQGITEFVNALNKYLFTPGNNNKENICKDPDKILSSKSINEPQIMAEKNDTFQGCIYKISRDQNGNRLTFMKILAGSLQVKGILGEEKVNEIRIYNGEKYESIKEAFAGDIVCIPGLKNTRNGQIIGGIALSSTPYFTPALSYAVSYPQEIDKNRMLQILKELEEEDPSLNVEYKEQTGELFVSLMGDVQTEILADTLLRRYEIPVSFSEGKVCYKETIDSTVIGVGHFEPLRHYAEVHIKMEPLETGSGLEFATQVSEDLLDKNWQRLVYTHLCEREHRGVLLGTPITDMRLTLVAGKAHTKHTEGGDFRQACYRAIRQGLMELRAVGSCHLLEPYYNYTLEIPDSYVGRAMTDISKMYGTADITENDYENHITVLTGRAPVVTIHSYVKEVISYTKGLGKLSFVLAGYDRCHNEDEVLAFSHYDPESDTHNPSSSVFCIHGSGTVIPWYEVADYMHLEYVNGNAFANGIVQNRREEEALLQAREANRMRRERDKMLAQEIPISAEEIDAILYRNSRANENGRKNSYKGISQTVRERARRRNSEQNDRDGKEKSWEYKPIPRKPKYMLVDGYNVIHAWKNLEETARLHMDAAVGQLNDILSNYQAITGIHLIVVYDAYKLKGHPVEEIPYQNIHIVYTKEDQTADQYIERYAGQNHSKYDITVVTSDGLEQQIIQGEGCHLLSSREFEAHVALTCKEFYEKYGVN